jgi:hypothetical protein
MAFTPGLKPRPPKEKEKDSFSNLLVSSFERFQKVPAP